MLRVDETYDDPDGKEEGQAYCGCYDSGELVIEWIFFDMFVLNFDD